MRRTPRSNLDTRKALRDVAPIRTVAAQLEKIETNLPPIDWAHRGKLASQIDPWQPIIQEVGLQAE